VLFDPRSPDNAFRLAGLVVSPSDTTRSVITLRNQSTSCLAERAALLMELTCCYFVHSIQAYASAVQCVTTVVKGEYCTPGHNSKFAVHFAASLTSISSNLPNAADEATSS